MITLKALEKAAFHPQWISIKDKEPPKNHLVLITDGKVIVVSFWENRHDAGPEAPKRFAVPIWEGHGFGFDESPVDWAWNFEDHEITHWMPLPELPGKEEHHDKRTV